MKRRSDEATKGRSGATSGSGPCVAPSLRRSVAFRYNPPFQRRSPSDHNHHRFRGSQEEAAGHLVHRRLRQHRLLLGAPDQTLKAFGNLPPEKQAELAKELAELANRFDLNKGAGPLSAASDYLETIWIRK